MRVYTLVLSIAVHLLLVAGVVVVPLVATDELPEPRRIVEFVHVTPEAVVIPPPARMRDPQPAEIPPRDGIPIEEPVGLEPEPIVAELFTTPSSIVDGALSGSPLPAEPVAPPPEPRERTPLRVGGSIIRPERVYEVAPVYPPVARSARVEGTVILEALIDVDGRVRDVRVLRSQPLLDAAAVEAVRQWRFTPTRLNGEPVPVVMTVTVRFELQ